MPNIISLALASLALAAAFLSHAPAETTGNLLANPSFESDWINAKAENSLINQWEEHGFNQQDLKPDAWAFHPPPKAAKEAIRWDSSLAHTGRYSLRLEGLPGVASVIQTQNYAAYQGVLGHEVFDLQATQGRFTAQENPILLAAADAPRFFRTVRLSAWCKASNAPEGSGIRAYGRGATLKFPAGSYDWTRLEAEVSGETLAQQFIQGLKGADKGALPASWTVTLDFTPAGAPGGTVWFDDIVLEEELPATPNLAANSGFEETDAEGCPAGWSRPKKFHYIPPSWYYVWRSWSHFFTVPRGQAVTDTLLARTGRRSFRFSVLPGDEYLCQSPPIEIRQDAARPIEIGVWLQADKIRYFDVRAVDERGIHLNEQSFITGTHNREFGAPYRGTFDWRYVRKFCVSDHPVQSLRVELCARGFNGLHLDDVGKKVTNNQVGTLWWDDLIVTQPASAGTTTALTFPPRPPARAKAVDFGERLYGENQASLTVENTERRPVTAQATLTLTPPQTEKGAQALQVNSKPITLPAGDSSVLALPFAIHALCPDWRSQYHLKIGLTIEGQAAGETEISFGTWPETGRVEIERVYAHPEEAKQQAVWANFGVTEATLHEVKSLRFDFIRQRDGKVVRSHRLKDFQKAREEFRQKQPFRDWWIDEFHLYLEPVDMSFLPAHDADLPARDHRLALVAQGRLGRELFRCESVPFGIVLPSQERLQPVQSVEVKDGQLHVNGRPFYLRASLGHSWDLEPAPSQREHWVKTTTGPDSKQVRDFSRVKAYGFNAFFPNVPYEIDYADDIWKANLYTAIWFPQNWFGLSFDESYGQNWKCASSPEAFEKAGRHPSILMASLTAWEGGMHPEIYTDPKLLEAQARFADEVRKFSRRPLFSSGGYSAHKQQYGTMWDIFGPESNWDGPSRVHTTALHPLRSLGKNVMGMDFPNIFSDMAYDLIRFETYEGIIRGQRGFIQIGRWNDISLYRGFNGELRYLEKFIFEPEQPARLSAEPVQPETQPGLLEGKPERYQSKISLMERNRDGATYVIATNAQPIRHGDWTWTEELKFRNRRAHTGETVFSRLYPDRLLDWHAHGYRDGKPVVYQKGDLLIQYVSIPREATVETLALMVEGDGRWNFNAVWGDFDFRKFHESKVRFRLTFELYRWLWSSFGHSRNTWWDEPYDDLFERDFLREGDFHRMAALPEKEQWAKLVVPVEAVGLAGRIGTGFEFLSKGGRVWWDYTAVERGGEVLVLCDDVLGASEQELSQIRFSGVRPGAVVRVPFEDRVMRADKSGRFVDNFAGENVYDNIWEGMFGDKLAPEAYYGGGYHYNYPKAAVRVYEIR